MEDQNQTCSDIRADLPLFVGGDLDAMRLECVESHLETCEGCRRGADRLSASRRVFQELAAAANANQPGPPNLWPAVRGGLRAAGLVGGYEQMAGHGRSEAPGPGSSGTERPGEATSPTGGASIFQPRSILQPRSWAAAAAVLVALVVAAALWPDGFGADGQRRESGGAELAEEGAGGPRPERGLRLLEPGVRGLLEDAVPFDSSLGNGLGSFASSALAGERHLTQLPGPGLPGKNAAQSSMGTDGADPSAPLPLLEEPPRGEPGAAPGPGIGGHIHLRRVR